MHTEKKLDPPPESSAELAVSHKKEGKNSVLLEFFRSFEEESSPEKKIRMSLEFMRSVLSAEQGLRLKDFWEARKRCLPLFKENIASRVRSQLWSVYVELSSEARCLKEILDEQSTFAVEQIELAIQGLEKDLGQVGGSPKEGGDVSQFFENSPLRSKREVYAPLHRELQTLNAFASRVNALRKEVVKTEMRIRIKTKLLERLSCCGDAIFPRRKELIKQVSIEFVGDVSRFVDACFGPDKEKLGFLHLLREKVKGFQQLAKELTLSSHAFTESRLKLSRVWDEIKDLEKQKRQEVHQKKVLFKQNFDLMMEKIRQFAQACETGISLQEVNRQVDDLLMGMKGMELGREEVKALKDQIFKIEKGPIERAREIEEKRLSDEKGLEAQRRKKLEEVKELIHSLIQQVAILEIEVLVTKREEAQELVKDLTLSKTEKQFIDRLLRQLENVIDERVQQKMLANLPEEQLKAIEQLTDLLEERRGKRQEIKECIEQHRKLLGGSGFDFEKAMLYREIIDEEKESLEQVDRSIEEIEEKIIAIESTGSL